MQQQSPRHCVLVFVPLPSQRDLVSSWLFRDVPSDRSAKARKCNFAFDVNGSTLISTRESHSAWGHDTCASGLPQKALELRFPWGSIASARAQGCNDATGFLLPFTVAARPTS